MKKATRILATIGFVIVIVTGGLLLLAGVVLSIIGGIRLASPDGTATPEQASITWTLFGLGLGYLFGAPAVIPGIIFEKIVRGIGETGPETRSKMILYGVLDAIFGWGPGGICCIVRGAISGKPEEPADEAKAEAIDNEQAQ